MLKIEANMYVLKIVQIYVDSVQLANTGSNQMIAIYCVNFPNHQYKNLSLIIMINEDPEISSKRSQLEAHIYLRGLLQQ